MGRKSKLSDEQWRLIGGRLLAGEAAADLSREYGVSKSSISERFSERNRTVRAAADKLVEAERTVLALPVSEQRAARNLADDLMEISVHLAGAGRFGAAIAHRLSGIAHGKVQEIDDAAPLNDKSREALRDVAVLTKLANESSSIAVNLLAANKDTVKRLNGETETDGADTDEDDARASALAQRLESSIAERAASGAAPG